MMFVISATVLIVYAFIIVAVWYLFKQTYVLLCIVVYSKEILLDTTLDYRLGYQNRFLPIKVSSILLHLYHILCDVNDGYGGLPWKEFMNYVFTALKYSEYVIIMHITSLFSLHIARNLYKRQK